MGEPEGEREKRKGERLGWQRQKEERGRAEAEEGGQRRAKIKLSYINFTCKHKK